ncbi:ABC transporter permease [Anaerovorax odorimutans]|uniref:ABC transporter permease n=1 Tax=Anaerovorax odorimutans TaxID=109327 RepID=A0ABT1RJ82_9FIRM|nr:FtsX-like permease family protein [Anaerovorax odorimutans]MCQ4635240.1 ABC transporter permease [Anaerovorax odorimutans]
MYETQNKKIIGHLAKSDLKSKKMGNVFIMITIILATSLLLVMGLFPGSVKLDLQRQLADAQDVFYMNVTKEQIRDLEQDDRISYMTLTKFGERMEVDDYIISHVYFDGNSKTIKVTELTEGRHPEKRNEVAVPKAYMKQIGKEAKVGTKIEVPLLSGKKEVCVVSGFTKDIENTNVYQIRHSKDYAEKGSTLKNINYDAAAKIANAKNMTQEEFSNTTRDIAAEAQIPRSQVNENNHFKGTLPEGHFSPEVLSFAIIGLIILVAGVMVIYSVFYISVTGKTRQYGQLRTLGMTKKQVRGLVRKEGLLLALRAAPIGLVLGGIISCVIKPGGFSLSRTLIMAVIVLVIILVTVLVSVMKPARLAASIPPIEAAKYSAYSGEEGKKQTQKLQRKITPFTLARMNSSRNRKKTFVTMLSLGIGGILFIGAVTFAVSMDKEKFARQGGFEVGEFSIYISENAAETAKHGEMEIKMESPFTSKVYDQIKSIPGVKKIYSYDNANIKYDYKDQKENEDMISPFSRKEVPEMKKFITEGALDYDNMLSEGKVLVRNNDVVEEIYGWRFEIGDKVTIHYWDGKEKTKTYEVAGDIGDYKAGFIDGWFLVPEEELAAQLPGINLTDNWLVSTDPDYTDKVEESLNQILDQNPNLTMNILRLHRAQSQASANQMILLIVAIVLFVVLFSMINLVNTLITNFMSQRTELAMLQSVGMTGGQISRLVMGEGLILAIGNIIISLIFGSLLGYGVCRLFAYTGLNYMVYQFPLAFSLIYVAIVILVPCVIAFFMIRKFQGQSLIDRLREV